MTVDIAGELKNELLRGLEENPFQAFDRYRRYRKYFLALLRPQLFASLYPASLYPDRNFSEWMEERFLKIDSERIVPIGAGFILEPNELLEHYLTVVHERREVVRALEFVVQHCTHYGDWASNYVMKVVIARMKRERVYWDVPSLPAFLKGCIEAPLKDPGEYGEAHWVQIERALSCILEEEDASFLPALCRLSDGLKSGKAKPHPSLGMFAQEDHLHYLTSRIGYLVQKKPRKDPDLDRLEKATQERARIEGKPSAYLRIEQPVDNASAREVVLGVSAQHSDDQAKVCRALSNFTVRVELQGFVPGTPEPPTSFGRETGECRIRVIPLPRSNRLWVTVKHGTAILLRRQAIYI